MKGLRRENSFGDGVDNALKDKIIHSLCFAR